MVRRQGLKQTANFTEEAVGLVLESYLTILGFPFRGYSIEPFSTSKERWVGADARLRRGIKGITPFYMQFKRPEAYPCESRAKIVADRKSLGLETAHKSLFFPLRKKQVDHFDYQHNILFRLRRRLTALNIGDAAYICPVFLELTNYREQMFKIALGRFFNPFKSLPWDFDDVGIIESTGAIHFDRVALFKEHVSIPPHTRVQSANHFYSFSEDGNQLCFHSPSSLPDGTMSLAKFLDYLWKGFLDRGAAVHMESADMTLKSLIKETLGPQAGELFLELPFQDDPLGNWNEWGSFLKSVFSIDQFVLIEWQL